MLQAIKTIINAMTNLASHSTSNPTTTSQYGAIAAYMGTQEPVEEMRKAFEERLRSFMKIDQHSRIYIA